MSEGQKQIVYNKTAHRNFEILDRYEAGIALTGSEVKSLREGAVSIQEAYISIFRGEAILIGCQIQPYKFARETETLMNRERKLLLHKTEINKLWVATKHQGMTIVPISFYFKNGKVKLELGLAKGKKLYDKRDDIKSRDAKKDIARAMKYKHR